jgi:hypothetical protein
MRRITKLTLHYDHDVERLKHELSAWRVPPEQYLWDERTVITTNDNVVDVVTETFISHPSWFSVETVTQPDQMFAVYLRAGRIVQANIIDAGGMANKSRVEDVLMPLFGIDRGTAHDVMNTIEYHNLKPIRFGGSHV